MAAPGHAPATAAQPARDPVEEDNRQDGILLDEDTMPAIIELLVLGMS
jgi:hypothetical protein